jgi:CRP-like cAMP-binding protein
LATRVSDRNDLIGATLRQVQLFSKWPADTIAALASAAQLWCYAKGEAVYEAVEPATGVYVIAEGSLISGRSWPNGYGDGDRAPPLANLRVACLGWGAESLRRYRTFGFAGGFHIARGLRHCGARRSKADRGFSNLLLHATPSGHRRAAVPAVGSPRCLIAKYLAYLSRPSAHMSLAEPDTVDPTAFDVTQDELAAMLNIARQTVNRLMKEMERNGVLMREGNRLRIVNFLKLLTVMEEDEPIYHTWRAQIIGWHAQLQGMDEKKAAAKHVTAPVQPRASNWT